MGLVYEPLAPRVSLGYKYLTASGMFYYGWPYPHNVPADATHVRLNAYFKAGNTNFHIIFGLTTDDNDDTIFCYASAANYQSDHVITEIGENGPDIRHIGVRLGGGTGHLYIYATGFYLPAE